MRKLLFELLLLTMSIVAFGQGEIAHADNNLFERIDIHVQLNEDGSADITEHWNFRINEGTEAYITKENLGKAKFEDFTVTGNGRPYEYIDRWDSNASFEEKAYKNSVIYMKNDGELVWGVSEYGSNEYKLEYTVTNIIKQLKDSQMLYWTFSNEDTVIPRANIRVEIVAPKVLHKDDEEIWGFGYPGELNFVNGNIVAYSDESMFQGDHVTLLVKFKDDTFSSGEKINKKFSYFEKIALKGSDYDGRSFFSKLISGATLFYQILKVILFFAIFVLVLVFISRLSYKGNNFNIRPKKFQRKYKEEYYREFPYKGDYLHAYYMVHMMGLSNFDTLLTSLLLKWIHEDKIHITETTSGMLRRKSQLIHILSYEEDRKTSEGRLFLSIKNTANKEGVVTDKQMSNWATRNYANIRKWEVGLLTTSMNKLEEENYLLQKERKFLIFTMPYRELTESGKAMEANFYKYVNYLHDYSLLNEREAVNVKLWDEMMIGAAFIGLTAVVMKQFAKLYPKYVDESKFKKDTVDRTKEMADRVERDRRRRARAVQRARSKGEGGRASRGGGGGSFGGGGGSGVR